MKESSKKGDTGLVFNSELNSWHEVNLQKK